MRQPPFKFVGISFSINFTSTNSNPHQEIMKKTTHGIRAGVRKGAWTTEEDTLLRDCIHKYGEEKWHLVPLRAGLNRCRKSCRLRWLNYLRPNIKKGVFSRDEVDLLKRMHKLLGNRWSLIAGRLPGRTANDIKNFWNTYIDRPSSRRRSQREPKTITESSIIRPRPRSFTKTRVLHNSHVQQIMDKSRNRNNLKNNNTESLLLGGATGCPQIDNQRVTSSSMHEATKNDGNCIRWWSDLLEINEIGELGKTLVFPEEMMQIEVPTLVSNPLLGYGENYQSGIIDDLPIDGGNFWDM